MPIIPMDESRTIGQGRRAVATVARSVVRAPGVKPAFPNKETP